MEPPSKRLHLSLEPPIPYLPDADADNLFALRPRLLDITAEGTRVYTRQGEEKSLGERLVRIWGERGDFSKVTVESILHPPAELEEDAVDAEDSGLTAEGMQELQGTLLAALDEARTQLITALDLLSILSPPTDPPAPDLPLPAGSIIITPAQPDLPPSLDPTINPLARLPLATSLNYIKDSAKAFFVASKSISREMDEGPVASTSTSPPPAIVGSKPAESGPTPPDLWSTILHFHSSTPYALLPLGAQRGATLNTAKGEERAAHQIGIFFGCEEGGEAFRRAAVSTVESLVRQEGGQFSGRKMVVLLDFDGRDEVVLWDELEEDEGKGKGKLGDIENLLRKRGRSAFAEEIFSIISEEARSNPAMKARFISGNRAVGESISTEGNGWSLRITMLVAPKIISSPAPKLALLILALLRILLLSIFAQRRASLLTPVVARPLLGTISTFLNHLHRLRNLSLVLEGLRNGLTERGIGSMIEMGVEEGVEKMAALRVVRGEKDLGGMIVFRVGKFHTYHITHSLPLPQSTPLSPLAIQQATTQSLVLHSPGSEPVSVPSLEHLEGFLLEQFKNIVVPPEEDGKEGMKGVVLT